MWDRRRWRQVICCGELSGSGDSCPARKKPWSRAVRGEEKDERRPESAAGNPPP